MRILFWNTNRNLNINPYIVNIIKDYGIDVLTVAEYASDYSEFDELLNKNNIQLIKCNTIGSDRINIWSNYPNVKAGVQNKYYSIQVFSDQFIICCVHLMSDLHGDQSDERLEKVHQIMHDIRETEERIDSHQTIIIGDFNEMPYDRGCLNANGFHGLPALSIEDRPTRVVNEQEYRKFYNPMWNLLGDFSYPPGTYYYNQAKLQSPMWYMLDQVIISKDVLPIFNRENLKIITTCSYSNLMDKQRHPNGKISDHFPIMCEIKDR